MLSVVVNAYYYTFQRKKLPSTVPNVPDKGVELEYQVLNFPASYCSFE